MARGNKFILSEVSFGPEILKLLSEAVHVNAMIAVVEAEAVAAAPKLRDWLISLVAFAGHLARTNVASAGKSRGNFANRPPIVAPQAGASCIGWS